MTETTQKNPSRNILEGRMIRVTTFIYSLSHNKETQTVHSKVNCGALTGTPVTCSLTKLTAECKKDHLRSNLLYPFPPNRALLLKNHDLYSSFYRINH